MTESYIYKDSKVKHRYKIVNPFRFFTFVLICCIVCILTAYAVFGSYRAEAISEPVYTEVKIQENDTLWNIVETYNPNLKKDVRIAVSEICEINGIDAGSIHPGDVIIVPVYK